MVLTTESHHKGCNINARRLVALTLVKKRAEEFEEKKFVAKDVIEAQWPSAWNLQGGEPGTEMPVIGVRPHVTRKIEVCGERKYEMTQIQ